MYSEILAMRIKVFKTIYSTGISLYITTKFSKELLFCENNLINLSFNYYYYYCCHDEDVADGEYFRLLLAFTRSLYATYRQ